MTDAIDRQAWTALVKAYVEEDGLDSAAAMDLADETLASDHGQLWKMEVEAQALEARMRAAAKTTLAGRWKLWRTDRRARRGGSRW